VVVTRIKKQDLRSVAEKQVEVLEGIAIALARRHYYNIVKIAGINRSIVEASLDQEEKNVKPSTLEKARRDFALFKRDLAQAIKGKDASFMQDLLDQVEL
jgi:hypothetical protein